MPLQSGRMLFRVRAWSAFKLSLCFFACIEFVIHLTQRSNTIAFSALSWLPRWSLISPNGERELTVVLGLSAIYLFIGRSRVVFALLAVLISYFTLAYFSVHGAFCYFIVVLLLFLSLHQQKEMKKASWAARVTLGLLFVFSGLYKCNAAFCSGKELRAGEFFWGSRIGVRPWLSELAIVPIAPYLVIFIEILIGLLCWTGAPLSALLITLFCMGLFIFQNGAAFVFFALLPLLLLGFPETVFAIRKVLGERSRAWLWIVPAFGVTLLFSSMTGRNAGNPIFQDILGALMILLLPIFAHPAIMKRSIRRISCCFRRFRDLKPVFWESLVGSPWLIGFALYCALPLAFPVSEPFSFTMFSGRNLLVRPVPLRLSDPDLCSDVRRRFSMRWVGFTKMANHLGPGPACTVYLVSSRFRSDLIRAICTDPAYSGKSLGLCDHIAENHGR